jgi:tRNA A-37 threonylcarbamoyl transferase component Bud32
VPRPAPLLRAFLEGYALGNPEREKEVRARARQIRGRVRYA